MPHRVPPHRIRKLYRSDVRLGGKSNDLPCSSYAYAKLGHLCGGNRVNSLTMGNNLAETTTFNSLAPVGIHLNTAVPSLSAFKKQRAAILTNSRFEAHTGLPPTT